MSKIAGLEYPVRIYAGLSYFGDENYVNDFGRYTGDEDKNDPRYKIDSGLCLNPKRKKEEYESLSYDFKETEGLNENQTRLLCAIVYL